MKTTVNELHCNRKEKKETRGDNKAGLSVVWLKVKAAHQPPGGGGGEGRRFAYLAWYRLGREGQGSRGAAGSDWLSENLVACQECGLQFSSFLLGVGKKKGMQTTQGHHTEDRFVSGKDLEAALQLGAVASPLTSGHQHS